MTFEKKAHLVAGGNRIDYSMHHTSYSTVRSASTRLFLAIAAANNLKARIGDIKNACIWAPCGEKMWSTLGPELDENEGVKMLIDAAAHGLKSS